MTSTRKTFFKSAVRFLPGWLAAVCLFAIVNCSHRERVVTVGITTWVSNSEYDRNIAGFKDELAARGFKEGDNIRFLARSCDADNTRQKE